MAYQAKDPATLENHVLHGTSLTLGPIYRESLLNRLHSVQKKKKEKHFNLHKWVAIVVSTSKTWLGMVLLKRYKLWIRYLPS